MHLAAIPVLSARGFVSKEGKGCRFMSRSYNTDDGHAPAEDAVARVRRLTLRLGYNANQVTVALLAELGVSGIANQVLFPLVTDRVHHILRDFTRQEQEIAAGTSRRSKRSRAGGTIMARPQSVPTPDVLKDPLAFLDFKILMAGQPGGYKLYRNLTLAEHEARRDIHQKNAAPALHSARSHQWAAAELVKHDAACLDDIEPEVLLRELPEEGIRA